jgi:hypothetical protein
MGDTLALQYGGSSAHNHFLNIHSNGSNGQWRAAAHSREMLTSVRRFYNNTYTDAEKQDAINLFLGLKSSRPAPLIQSL